MLERTTITPEDLYALENAEDVAISPDGHLAVYTVSSIHRVAHEYRRAIWAIPCEAGKARRFTYCDKQDMAPAWSPVPASGPGQQLAFVSTRWGDKPQIYVIPADGGEARRLTEQRRGVSSPAWSPDGRQIAFLSRCNGEEREREDRGEKPPPPVDKWEADRRLDEIKHQEELRVDPRVIRRFPYRTGTDYVDGHCAHVYVVAVGAVDEEHPTLRRLTQGEENFSAPSWSPDGQFLYSTLTRDPERDSLDFPADVVRITVADGQMERIEQPGWHCSDPRPSPDGQWIAFLRVPDRNTSAYGPRLAVMPVQGGAAFEVAPTFDRSVEAFRWAPDSQSIVFLAGDQGDTGLYRVPARGGDVVPLVSGTRQVLAFDVAADGRLAFVACTPLSPPEVFTAAADGSGECQLTAINARFLESKAVGETEELWYRAPDGVEIQGWIVKPPGFDPAQRYPLILQIHGGPHVMWGPSEKSMWHEWQCMAGAGYVVFYCNPRGSEGHGHAFRDAIHGRWGEADMPDILAGVEQVVARGYVDADRLAVTGGSYGGFMTTWILGHDGRFAAGATQRGVYHLCSFHGTSDVPLLIEWEFDTFPWQDPERMWQHSPLAHARNIAAPLLILHSERDFRAPISDGEQLFMLLRRLRRTVEFVRYPREGHELSRSGEPRHRVDRLQRIIGWFDAYCKLAEDEE